MCKRILSVMVSTQEKTHAKEFSSGINILYGQDGEDVLLTLAGIFGGMPPLNGKAEIQWNTDVSLFVSVIDGACGVERVKLKRENIEQLVKEFHKQRFLNFNNLAHILDGTDLPTGFAGTNDLLLEKLYKVLATEDDRPLFLCNFVERLDEAVDLHPIFEMLLATGRQVFISVPHYYQLGEMYHDTTVHTF